MKKWLKRHFIPHEDNGHRPEFLNSINIRQIAGVVLFFELILFILPHLNNTTYFNNIGAVLPSVLSTLTNEERGKNNLPELAENPLLNLAAQRKAEDMASKSYFAHNSPDGKTSWYWFDQVGYQYSFAGENLAVNFSDSKDVTEAWMNSPTHKENIIRAGYTEVGTGVANGMYEGKETIFVAQMYGRPVYIATSPTTQKNALSQPAGFARSTPLDSVRDVFPEQSASSQTLGENAEVLGEAQPPITNVAEKISKSPSFWQRALSSPRDTTNAVLYTILSIVIVALFLNIVIHFEHQHRDLITNGLVMASLIFALHLGNGYVSKSYLETSYIEFTPVSANTAQS